MVINIAQNIIDGRNLQYAPAGYTIGVQSSKVVLENGKVYNFVNAVVTSVVSGSDVDKAGLSVGDVISSITYCGKTISFDTLYTYEEIKYCLKVGDTITYTISGSSKTVVVQVSSVAI
jgi:S1-C subfamily serine protease